MPRPLRPLRPFHEAALILFSAGASPAVVGKKFCDVVSVGTIYRWYYQWAEIKGIDHRTQLENGYGRVARRPEYESELAKARRESRKRLAKTRSKAASIYDDDEINPQPPEFTEESGPA
jgi:hypothetical protein